MSDLRLKKIESKIDRLIAQCAALEKENALLKANESSWQQERTRLIEKNEMARSRVEAMITHLKSIDTE
jgi:cell division protein ZapB